MTDTARTLRHPTETRNDTTEDIDLLATEEVLRCINDADTRVPRAVAEVLPQLARVVDTAVAVLNGGGRIHYFGAGTSGRLATLDAAELPPTYGIAPDRVIAHNAGGQTALLHAVENVEDDVDLGGGDAAGVTGADLALGLSASGSTPYVAGALAACRAAGATTVLLSANPGSPLASGADIHIGVDTGPEVITGSTRMKAGTAQKLLLNTFSTAVMVKLGRTYSNLMVAVQAGNAKLRRRALTILTEATDADEETCAAVLAEAEGNTRVALASLLGEVSVGRASTAVHSTGGSVRRALDLLRGGTHPPPEPPAPAEPYTDSSSAPTAAANS